MRESDYGLGSSRCRFCYNVYGSVVPGICYNVYGNVLPGICYNVYGSVLPDICYNVYGCSVSGKVGGGDMSLEQGQFDGALHAMVSWGYR